MTVKSDCPWQTTACRIHAPWVSTFISQCLFADEKCLLVMYPHRDPTTPSYKAFLSAPAFLWVSKPIIIYTSSPFRFIPHTPLSPSNLPPPFTQMSSPYPDTDTSVAIAKGFAGQGRLKRQLSRQTSRQKRTDSRYAGQDNDENGNQQGEDTPLLAHILPHSNGPPPYEDERTWVRWPSKVVHTTWQVLKSNYVNVLLVFVPLGIISGAMGWSPTAVFLMNFFAIIPLAALLSFATEELSVKLGQTLGGLLNASFGNAVELIVRFYHSTHFSA